jgi:3-methyladenine DNA glycosylase/8-oxoguanine DNA glycosylase
MREPIHLQVKHVLEFIPKAPFNFDTSMHKPDHFPSPDNEWEPGIRWQTMLWNGKTLGLRFENKGTIEQPKVSLSVWSEEELANSFLSSLSEEVSYRYNLLLDLTEFNQRFEDDIQLGPIINRWRGMRPSSYSSLYEFLIIAIVLQNANVRRSANMMKSLFENYGTRVSYNGKELYCFWQPNSLSGVSEQELRGLKIGYRAKFIKGITEAFALGRIDENQLRKKTREEQRQALLGLYGIGPASVGYILFDVFNHMDELNHISPWEQKIYSRLFFNKESDEPVPVEKLLEFCDSRFGEYKMLAVHYIWEDLFWKRKYEEVAWLEKLIRL